MTDTAVNRTLQRLDPGGWPAQAQRALALSAYALLALCALETALSGWRARWLVLLIVAAYLGGSGFVFASRKELWQRSDWLTKARFSLVVFLLLVVGAAWVPSGLTQGLRVLTLAPSTVLLLSLAGVYALASHSALRFRWPERFESPLRIAVLVLLAYALLGVAAALWQGLLFVEFMAGGAFWSALPRVLQSPFVGTFVLIPLGGAAELLTWRAGRSMEAKT